MKMVQPFFLFEKPFFGFGGLLLFSMRSKTVPKTVIALQTEQRGATLSLSCKESIE